MTRQNQHRRKIFVKLNCRMYWFPYRFINQYMYRFPYQFRNQYM